MRALHLHDCLWLRLQGRSYPAMLSNAGVGRCLKGKRTLEDDSGE